ncbi:ADYC domain-containing protein [Microvirga sp. Mcv34]|uniref:ADYC domain-containing protein n=1 Tax=Microvirga sp. Mcv34 TaxID=2926016 RepID=UPI0021C65793|nr:ADYC domain-containing protein [Microvirga sp. Mcv34]
MFFFLRIGAFILALLAAPALAREGRFVLEGLDLTLRLSDGTVLKGDGLVGLTLTAGQPPNQTDIRIDDIVRNGPLAKREIAFYRMSLQDTATGASQSLCAADPDGERAAFAFPNDAGGFSITCTSGAEGKCILFGYRPWETRDGVPLRDLHKACVHMLRADYGGDDRPTTRDGTAVNIYDRLGIQHPDPAPGMAFEAAWGAEGAVCVSHTRIADNITLEELAERYPRLRGRLGPHVCSEEAMRADPLALLYNQSVLTSRSDKR